MGIKFWNLTSKNIAVDLNTSTNPHAIGTHVIRPQEAFVAMPGDEGMVSGIFDMPAPFHHDANCAWVFDPQSRYSLYDPELFDSSVGRKIIRRHEGTVNGVNISFTRWSKEQG